MAGGVVILNFNGSNIPDIKSESLPTSSRSICSDVKPLALIFATNGGALELGVLTVIHCDLLTALPELSVAVQTTSVRELGEKPLPITLLTSGFGSATSKTTAVPISKSSVVICVVDSITRLGGTSMIGALVSSTLISCINVAIPLLPPPIGPVSSAVHVTKLVPKGNKNGASFPNNNGISHGSVAVINDLRSFS